MANTEISETRLKILRIGGIVIAGFGTRLLVDPKGQVLQMAKNKRPFEDDQDERVIMARVSMNPVFEGGVTDFQMNRKP